MKNSIRKISALATVFVLLFTLASVAGAASVFEDGAYASIVTGSDFQDSHDKAYNRYERVLSRMKADGLGTPHSVLVGGDYSKVLFDDANPGVFLINDATSSIYPDMDENGIICIQGNHDNPAVAFTKTGFYDMGAYCLYVINEDDFPWSQFFRSGCRSKVKELAADIEKSLDDMISSSDIRPVIVITHVPLHHTNRSFGGDNLYSSYVFDVLNKAGETLDVIFLFGHNHSSTYDDYIGGSVNFLAPGDEIRIPDPDKLSKTEYLTKTLNFTYTNCGYIGYSGNTVTDTSTDVLTLGCIRFREDSIRFVKYSEDGLVRVDEVERKNSGSGNGAPAATELQDDEFWDLLRRIYSRFSFLLKLFFLINVY